ncbi:MAG: 4-hydroxy-tetrahydrodipicolinate reductase [Epulopiscium sp.]|jgi:4-hydroxy-tetrahydrodipicolinate reductase|uniref:4-hydroxy-tetrahydrodipicolinate reductase n=1 Tax=Defluviitalea raffinosedens TaxID=1450156 RepID=A0A7C8HHL4_9FIRM|nr:4-hydroxy-tetrahydrodipicolinate reductase [Defluviitalea raffinosedens]MBZ4667994.1 dihydrodipicolinate reductase [Defluviitaleaceae bacterium]MDK2787852.1 4-hydroxy-tetrahydrodipicolinate reductase [Candidatus Epulonipiscium sp.]KAE9633409.1 4-hydroxy-tetrahydrodipicolinate reductase [Defluviitalea raffinosedens]MBM7687070.1 4-hydroxy-tetrahydrodipicolinate reductase [Defluviitalea raffinosedens]HHW68216.1 4-hydroxy-tetrahydrodipicolinate reductase [Candidatus Epulonipiscium sp.]
MIKIIMHGCNGKMGQVISSLVDDSEDCMIAAGIDPNVSKSNPYPVFNKIDDCDIHADVIIDFSTATAVKPLLEYALVKQLPVVICTTGLSEDMIDLIKKSAKKIPIFFSANMSLGINLLISLVKRASEILSDANFDIEIIEKHHNQKIDAPSGTALALADAINEALDHQYTYKYDRHSERKKRDKKEIGIHAVRGGTIVGEHSVIFAGKDEIIELNHTAMSKEVFAVGALKAAKFLAGKAPGLYNMDHLINQ